MNRINHNSGADWILAWEKWAIVRHLNQVRYPDQLDTLREAMGEKPHARLPSDAELDKAGVDLFVLDRELKMGMPPELFKRALRLGVLDVQSFNDSPRKRENRSEFYSAMATVIDRVETRRRRQFLSTR